MSSGSYIPPPVKLTEIPKKGVGLRPLGILLANLFLHYCMDKWLDVNYSECPFERYADDALIYCSSMTEAIKVKNAIGARLSSCGMELHAEKTHVVYCKDSNRRHAGVQKKSFF